MKNNEADCMSFYETPSVFQVKYGQYYFSKKLNFVNEQK